MEEEFKVLEEKSEHDMLMHEDEMVSENIEARLDV